MNFLYPLGLLGLIGIPILIIIYIIKNKYTEKTIASTYIWTVSERFLKRKRPVSRLVGLISLILQIVAVTFISVAIAHPVIVEANAAHEYCFVIDASGSMNMESDGTTRFESGKKKIEEIIDDSLQGSYYTLISVDGGVNVVYRKATDKKTALAGLHSIEPSSVDMNTDLAIETAQEIFNENTAVKTYLITDKTYEQADNVEIINVAQSGVNYSIIHLEGIKTVVLEEDRVHFKGSVTASGLAEDEMKNLTLALYVDDVLVKEGVEVGVKSGEPSEFLIETECADFSKAKLVLKDEDNLYVDNEYVLYDIEKENLRKTLIVSEEGFFLKSFIETVNVEPTLITPEEYGADYETGYDLYVFDCFAPETMPTDGVVWFFAPPANVSGSGFALQGKVEIQPHVTLDLTTDSSTQVQKLIKDISNRERISVTEFIQYSADRNFTTLYSYKSIPIIFTGVAASGYREVVFAFDIHNSNFPILYDCPVLLNNLWEFSFPDVVEKVVYESGEEVQINALPGCVSIRVDGPDNEMTYLEIAGGASIFTPTETGEYLITMKVGDVAKTYNIYSILPESEREVTQSATVFNLNGQATEGGLDGIEDIIFIAFIILAVMFIADWMVYCYDKYQLR